MTEQSLSIKKPGRPAKKDNTEERLINIERCLAKLSHFTGQQRILDEFGIDRWEPGEKDLRKHRG